MDIVVFANDKQLDEVDVTIKMTMKLKEWKMISDALRRDSLPHYHWTKAQVANAIEQVFEDYHKTVLANKEP